MALSKGIELLALQIQSDQDIREAAMMHGNVRSRLQSAVDAAHKDSGYGYYVDHSGDGESGDVVYQSNGKLKKAAYTLGKGEDGKQTSSIAHDKAKPVTAVTSYKEAGSASGVESPRKPLSSEDIARLNAVRESGNLTADQVQSVLVAVSFDAQEIRECFRGTPSKDTTWKPDGALLVESAKFSEEPRLQEAATTDYPIKLISPGRGSSGYYPFEVLKKAAEAKVFKAGTQMFWNHDTDAEESSRPEGDLNRLAAVTTTDAKWEAAGHDGPGLYARAKVFSDYSDKVKEKGPHIGLSIRAGGTLDESAMGPDNRKGVITALRNAASVDFVTKAGRDGKIFVESQRTQEGETMDKAEIQAIFKESLDAALAPLQAQNKKLAEALATQKMETTVPKLVEKALSDIRLPDATKRAILEKFTSPTILALLPVKEGAVDEVELTKMVEAEAVRQKDYLVALGWNSDVLSQGVRMTEAELKADSTKNEESVKEALSEIADIFVGPAKKGNELRESARESFMKGRIQ